jgi:hypothetical protein
MSGARAGRTDGKVRAAGYVRVSQERNARNGWGLGAQEGDVARYVQFKCWEPAEVYREEGERAPRGGRYSYALPERRPDLGDGPSGLIAPVRLAGLVSGGEGT